MPTPLPTEPHHAASAPPFARFDLEEELRRMRTAARAGGHLAKTLVRTADLRVVLMTLQRGARIPEHRAGGSLSIQQVDGRVILTLPDGRLELLPGHLVTLGPDVTHALEAADDSAVLLTISYHGHRSS